jgi:hypothetical protein
MDLYCRNPVCEYFSRPTPGRGNSIRCPSCGHPLLGGSVLAPGPNDPPPADIRESEHGKSVTAPTAKPPVAPDPVERAARVSRSPTPERSPGKPDSSTPRHRADDPNLTRPFDGPLPTISRKPRFVLELIENGRANPMDFIDEVHETPLYSRGEGEDRRHLANLRSTSEGVELTPIGSGSRFFVQITSPVRLTTGSRFRIGDFVIETRLATPRTSLDPEVEPGKPHSHQELTADGELVFLRADGRDGLRFPILRNILIGRGGPGDPHVDIPLRAPNVSRKHAAVALSTNGLKLKNLSRHGTFVESRRPRLLVEGDRFRLGESLYQLVRYARPS